YRIDEAVSAIRHDATLPECSRAKQMTINFELEDMDNREIDAIEKSCKDPRLRESSTEIVENRTNVDNGNSTSELKLDEGTNKDRESDSTWAVWNDVVGKPKRNYQSPFTRHDHLTLTDLLSCPNRRIVSYAPRNTKPPIKEPNMPEKREKKDDKKDKKKKKPVIRMESGSYENEGNAGVTNLHDNMDVNFQWRMRFPEESDTSHQSELKENWSKDTRQMENMNSVVGDSNCSNDQDVKNTVQAMRNLQLMMSSAKDTEKKKDDIAGLSDEMTNKPSETTSTDPLKNINETANLDSLKKILKTSPTLMKETSVDEDYNVPNNADFDAEINAWKDLVLKSKVPLDPSKEDFLNSERRSEMLSIKPEPPEPKLDVQAVPSSSDEAAAEEEDAEHAREFKGNVMNVKRTSNPTDFQKVDSKKLHTGPSCFSRTKSRSSGFSWILNSLDVNDVNLKSSDFSTDAESGWGNFQQTVSRGTSGINREQLKNEQQNNLVKGEGVEENVANIENPNENVVVSERQQETRNFESQEQSDRQFADSLNTVAEKEIESFDSLNRDTKIYEDSVPASSQRDSRKYETDEYLKSQTDNYQLNFDYANPYEDDFYPSYESLESTAEQSLERNEKSSVASEQQQISNSKEMKFLNEMEQPENRGEHTTDDNYIRVPGDPYPYSREHFNKWRWHENYDIGPPKTAQTEEVSNSPIDNSNTSVEVDTQQPTRKMSYLFRIEPAKLNDPPSEDPSSSSDSIILENSANPPSDGGSLVGNGEIGTDLGETEDSKKINKKKEEYEHVETIHPEIHTQSSAHIPKKDVKKTVKKEDIERIYEQKNYAYLRPEEMKNLRLVSKPIPEDTDPDTHLQKSGKKK
ncbi:unnamed protein product, partial [Heterotrigona itama]